MCDARPPPPPPRPPTQEEAGAGAVCQPWAAPLHQGIHQRLRLRLGQLQSSGWEEEGRRQGRGVGWGGTSSTAAHSGGSAGANDGGKADATPNHCPSTHLARLHSIQLLHPLLNRCIRPGARDGRQRCALHEGVGVACPALGVRLRLLSIFLTTRCLSVRVLFLQGEATATKRVGASSELLGQAGRVGRSGQRWLLQVAAACRRLPLKKPVSCRLFPQLLATVPGAHVKHQKPAEPSEALGARGSPPGRLPRCDLVSVAAAAAVGCCGAAVLSLVRAGAAQVPDRSSPAPAFPSVLTISITSVVRSSAGARQPVCMRRLYAGHATQREAQRAAARHERQRYLHRQSANQLTNQACSATAQARFQDSRQQQLDGLPAPVSQLGGAAAGDQTGGAASRVGYVWRCAAVDELQVRMAVEEAEQGQQAIPPQHPMSKVLEADHHTLGQMAAQPELLQAALRCGARLPKILQVEIEEVGEAMAGGGRQNLQARHLQDLPPHVALAAGRWATLGAGIRKPQQAGVVSLRDG